MSAPSMSVKNCCHLSTPVLGAVLFDLNEGDIVSEGEVLAERPIHVALRWVPQHDFLSHLAEQNEVDFKLQFWSSAVCSSTTVSLASTYQF